MLLFIYPCGPVAANMMFFGRDGSKTVAVVDPSDADLAFAVLKEHGWTLSDILVTHRHFDHMLGVAALKAETNATIYVSEEDACGLTSNLQSLSLMQRISITPVEPDVKLHDGDTFEAAGLRIRALATPGHTVGGMTFVCDEARCAFCGDTLFRESYGRTDLPTGDWRAIRDSIRDVILQLPEDYRLYPGHDEATTVAHERAANPIISEEEPWFV